MFDRSLAFDSPWYLLLLGLLPLVWYLSRDSLAGLGRGRHLAAVAFRSVVLALLALALADMQYRHKSDRVTVLYLLDQSLSIPEVQRQVMVDFVNESVTAHLREEKEDRVGVIVFGREAEVETPPLEFFVELRTIESLLDPQFTNLAGALRRARALFPEDTAKRIVVVTDGNENLGDALTEARSLADAGIGIDVLPVALPQRSEAAVEKVTLPSNVRQGQPFELRAVLLHDTLEGTASTDTPPLAGTLRILRKAGDLEQILAETPVELPPGKSVFSISETIDRPDFYTYQARFTPTDPGRDNTAQNNVGTAFTHVRGKGHVLLIEDWTSPGEFDHLVQRLSASGLQVTVQPSNQLFTSLPELQRYDTVILANVPRSSGDDVNGIANFSDSQIDMLVRNTEELGCGLVMLGGRNSFGAGGWTNTALEKAMPVDFQVKSGKVIPVGALALMMHASEMAQGNYWQKRIAAEAIQVLGDRDYAGLIQWNMTDQWLWGQSQGGLLPVGPNRNGMLARIDKMSVGDMPTFGPAMQQVANSFARLATQPNPPSVKHMIIISDGDPSPPSQQLLQDFQKMDVKITTVAVGAHGTVGTQTMRDIAAATGGKYYVVRNANALPRIYQREARRISRPLVRDLDPPVPPILSLPHDIVQGISPGAFPPVGGFVMTSVKESPLVEVILRSPQPAIEANSTLLAAWPYGLGKTVVWTTDVGQRWARNWTEWEQYDQLFTQMIRWSMRPTGDTGNFSVSTQVEDGQTRVIIDALDEQEQFLNVQAMTATVVGPDMQPIPMVIDQVAPGRYTGQFDSLTPGSYMISILPAGNQGLIRTGVNVGYSQEFGVHETNLPLLETMAQLETRNGQPGKLLGDEETGMLTGNPEQLPQFAAADPYRRDLPPAISTQSVWPYLVLWGSCLFVADVFIRRVQISFTWLATVQAYLAQRLWGRQPALQEPATLRRLQSRKAELHQQLDQHPVTPRYELTDSGADGGASPLAEPPPSPPATPPKASDHIAPTGETSDAPSYTSRLLKAKKNVWKDQRKSE